MNIRSWDAPKRILFRFAFAYFLLLFLPTTMEPIIPFSGRLVAGYGQLWHGVVRWIAVHAFHLGPDIPYFGAEINNTQSGLILWLCYFVLAIVAGLTWFLLDRAHSDDESLYQWFRLFLRVSLALVLIQYGTFKLIPSQMIAPPPLGVLMQRVGELTPMRLLWVFTGASPVYESLTGFAELLAGVLLLIPRTVLAGALLATVDMAMVFTLNMCYDVPVKLFSVHLLLLAIVLVIPDVRRLANMFFLNRVVEPGELVPLLARPDFQRVLQVLVLIAGSYAIAAGLVKSYRQYEQFHPPRPPLYGIWSVGEFSIDGRQTPPFSDPQRWRFVIFQQPQTLSIEFMIGSRHGYRLLMDENSKQLTLEERPDNADTQASAYARFSFSQPNEETLVLDGILGNNSAHIKLNRLPLRANFHWVFVPPKED